MRVNFVDFWPGFNKIDNFFYNILQEDYNIIIDELSPDYLFFSVFGNEHKKYSNCIKIFYTGENIPPPDYCDWSFSFEPNSENNFRLPHFVLYDGYYDLLDKKIESGLNKRKFCNFVASNSNCPFRNNFVKELSKYKKVDCGGRWMNNIGYYVNNKRVFQSEYKFSIAFENEAYRPFYPWYITEKIMEPMTVNSIPIYYGGEKVVEDFNEESFLNLNKFNNINDMIDYVISIDQDDRLYDNMINKPWVNNIIKKEYIKSFFEKIIK